MIDVAIVSSAHWIGDARLNRHVEYLRSGGLQVEFFSPTQDQGRPSAFLAALIRIMTVSCQSVILPDPELFLIGSLVARLRGSRPIIDIHEDYPKAAATRTWVPDAMRPIVRWATAALVALGRWTAWRVVVAAPEFQQRGDYLVRNVPDPSGFSTHGVTASHILVYVGDVTVARGALEMIDVLAALDSTFELRIIGSAKSEVRQTIEQKAAQLDVEKRVAILGRMPLQEAWANARGSLVGFSLLRSVPAYQDAVATKIWEYMAAGIPPIVSALPGQSRVVSELDPLLVCSSPVDCANVIRRLSTDHAFYDRLVQKGTEIAEKRWEETRPDRAIQEAVAP